jgi:NADH:ubiquinone oxidoreductase subunit D
MHTSYFRFGGVYHDLNLGLVEDIRKFSESFKFRLFELSELLESSRI